MFLQEQNVLSCWGKNSQQGVPGVGYMTWSEFLNVIINRHNKSVVAGNFEEHVKFQTILTRGNANQNIKIEFSDTLMAVEKM